MPDKIADSGLTAQTEETLFPSRRKKQGAEAEDVSKEPIANMEITSPAHLWNLGAVRIHLQVSNFMEAAAMVGQCQEMWRRLEEGYAERIEEVEALKNRVTLPQIEMLEDLAGQVGEDVPDNIEEMSKTAASKLISDWMQQVKGGGGDRQQSRRPSRNARRPQRSSSGAQRSGRSRRNDGGGSGGDSITAAQKRYIRQLCSQVDEDVPEDVDDMTKREASDYIQTLEGERD